MLTPEEEREVVRYLKQNPQAAVEVREHLEAISAFALSQPPAELPADAVGRLSVRIRRAGAASGPRPEAPELPPQRVLPVSGEPSAEPEAPEVIRMPRARRSAWWLGLAAVAAALMLVWLGFLGAQLQVQQAQRQLEATCALPGAVCQPLVDDADQPIGTLARRPNGSLFVLLEQEPPAAQVYQAWEIVNGMPISVGVFEARVIDIAEPLTPESVFCLTLEPPGGSVQPTSQPFMVVQL